MNQKKLDIDIIKKYFGDQQTDHTDRNFAWNNCYKIFKTEKDNETLALHLGFYLASWGMYRGSSGLLQKNHLVHVGAVEILKKEEYQKINGLISNDIVDSIMQLKKELVDYYSAISYKKGIKALKVSATDTLISKIMLGTLACVPAYDRYFIDGLKYYGLKKKDFKKESLIELEGFINENISEIKKSQELAFKKTGFQYPIMKIIDMYFWQIGLDEEVKRELAKNQNN